ncbi:hypothetical protein ACFPK9_02650 [Rubritalea spongiae]|uniref:Peptidase C39-like domain-containing protein n=1 Tax=Rubritalea spongiae TaxID=430797 RepID=A0ABW5E7W3_9BACT
MLRFFMLPLLASYCCAEMVYVPHRSASAVDQTPIHENACGPVSWINSYRFSSENWRAITCSLTGSDQQQFDYLTKKHAFQFSKYAYLQRRWNENHGIQPRDLLDACNDFHKVTKLPQLNLVSLFLQPNESYQQLLIRTQTEMLSSLSNGFPPMLYLTRFEKRTSSSGGHRWTIQTSHYVTLYAVDDSPPEETLTFKYIDPVGARICSGSVNVPDKEFYAIDVSNLTGKGYLKNPSLVAKCPETQIGSPHQKSELVLALMLVANDEPEL